MRGGYYSLKKLNEMSEDEWDELAEEELDELLTLADGVKAKRTASMNRVPKGDPSRPVLKRP